MRFQNTVAAQNPECTGDYGVREMVRFSILEDMQKTYRETVIYGPDPFEGRFGWAFINEGDGVILDSGPVYDSFDAAQEDASNIRLKLSNVRFQTVI